MLTMSDQDSKSTTDWQELTRLTQGQKIVVERVRLRCRGSRLFRLPRFALHQW